MAEPNDFTIRTIKLTSRQRRALAAARLKETYGPYFRDADTDKLSEDQLDEAAYGYLASVINTGSSAKLRAILGDADALAIESAAKAALPARPAAAASTDLPGNVGQFLGGAARGLGGVARDLIVPPALRGIASDIAKSGAIGPSLLPSQLQPAPQRPPLTPSHAAAAMAKGAEVGAAAEQRPYSPLPTGEDLIRKYAPQLGIPLDVALTIYDMEHGAQMANGTYERASVAMTAEDAQRNPGYIKEGDRARGPMQVMPGEFRGAGIPESQWDDTETGVQMGLAVLKRKYEITKDWRLAAKAYNGSGPQAEAYLVKFDSLRPQRQAEVTAGGAAGGVAGPRAPKTETELWAMSQDELVRELVYAQMQPSKKTIYNEKGEYAGEEESQWPYYATAIKTVLAARFPNVGAERGMTPQEAARAAASERYAPKPLVPTTVPQPFLGEEYGPGAPPPSPSVTYSKPGPPDPVYSMLTDEQLYDLIQRQTGPQKYTDAAGDEHLTPVGEVVAKATDELKRRAEAKKTGLEREKFDWQKKTDEQTRQDDLEKERQRLLEMRAQFQIQGQAAIAAAKRDAMNRAGEMIRIPPGGLKFPAGASGFTPEVDVGKYAMPFDFSAPVKEEEARMAAILARLGVK